MKLLPTRVTRVLRRLGRAPLFTFVSVLTLALGIGANTAIFSVIQGVLLKPLPFDHPDELVGVWHTAPGLGVPLLNQAPAFYLTYREEGRTFEDSGMWDTFAVSVTGTGEPERVDVLAVTDCILPVLRIQPVLGRLFRLDTERLDRTELIILITPHVIRDREEARSVTEEFESRIRNLKQMLQRAQKPQGEPQPPAAPAPEAGETR